MAKKTKKTAAKKVATKAPKKAAVKKPAKAPKKAKAPKDAAPKKTAPKKTAFADAPKKQLKALDITKEAHELLGTFADGADLDPAEALDKLIRTGISRLAALAKYTPKAKPKAQRGPVSWVADDEEDDDVDLDDKD